MKKIFDYNLLSELALEIGIKIREEMHKVPYKKRGQLGKSILKGEETFYADILGEEIAFSMIKDFAKRHEINFKIILDLKNSRTYDINFGDESDPIYCFLDPVDGTLKVTGLRKSNSRTQIGSDGAWGCGISFTKPTTKMLQDIKVGDFIYSALVEGCPPMYDGTYPTNAFTVVNNKEVQSYERLERDKYGYKKGSILKLTTSSQERMDKAVICLDAFETFDGRPETRETIGNPGKFAGDVYKLIVNTHEGGAFAVWSAYGAAAEYLRQLFGYDNPNLPDAMGSARIALNDDWGNCIPCYSIFKGAGGEASDWRGSDLGDHNLSEKRTNVVFTANSSIKNKIFALIEHLEK